MSEQDMICLHKNREHRCIARVKGMPLFCSDCGKQLSGPFAHDDLSKAELSDSWYDAATSP